MFTNKQIFFHTISKNISVSYHSHKFPFRDYEFPQDRLRLGKLLGSGAFGRVLKGEASGIVSWESLTTVAVKMVEPNADITCIKALMSELKIMMHLGKHLNIVNLLGACTTSLARRNLFVIVEYCRYILLLHINEYLRKYIIVGLETLKSI